MNTKDIDNKLEVLKKVASKFNKNKIRWAVGASLLLYFKNIAETFNDIDIVIDEKDVDKAKEILLSLGTMKERDSNEGYKTKCFLEFIIDNVELDIMAGFTIIHEGRDFYFPLIEDEITKTIKIKEENIPLHSVKAWRNYYYLMGRTKKVEMIDKFIMWKKYIKYYILGWN